MKSVLIFCILLIIVETNASISGQLVLTKYIQNGTIQEAQRLATVAHPKFLTVRSYSGYLTVNETTDSQMFFWFIRSEQRGDVPLILWLQGGPGISSMYGLFLEVGPFVSSGPSVVELREYSWHKRYNLLFFDNPVGVGFSTSHNGYATNEEEVGRDMYTAMLQFLQLFPDMANQDFYIAGESFGSKFTVALGHTIHINKENNKNNINLKGFIGISGVYDLSKQMNYADFLYQHGFVDDAQKEIIFIEENKFMQAVEDEKYTEAFEIYSDLILNAHEVTHDGTLFNNFTGMYNTLNYLTTQINETLQLNMEMFLDQEDIKKALHVGGTKYQIFEGVPRNKLLSDIPKSITPWVIELISNYKFLSLSGGLDVIIPYTFQENYWLNMDGISDLYKNIEKKLLYVDDEVVGFSKSIGNLTQVLIHNAGHSVPRDKPEATFLALLKFINGDEFD